VDPLAHALFGAALAKSSLGRRSAMSAGALVIGSVAPDMDTLAWLIGGREAWLKVHAGLSHSPFGLLLLGLALVPLLRWVEREFFRPSSVFSAGGRPGTCAVATIVGLLSHVPLDLLTDHGARPWTPFSEAWVRWDLVYPSDPWLWLIFGGTAALAGKRTARGSVLLVGAALLGWLGVLQHTEAPTWLRWVFPAACVLLAWLRAADVGRKHANRTLRHAAGLTFLYLCLLASGRSVAWARAAVALDQSAPGAVILSAHPRFGTPLAWSLFARSGQRLLEVRVRWGAEPELLDLAQTPGHPLVRTAMRLEQSATWRKTARLPLGTVEPEPDGSAWVELRDAAEAGRPWDEALRWRYRFPPEEVSRIQRMFEEEARLRGRGE
jgi:membrane-bound metal-dependent hydrolase YbcI (DUF457 family)